MDRLVSTAERISTAFDRLFARDAYKSVVICPPHPRRAPIHRVMLSVPNNLIYTAIWNSFGLPALVAPVGLTDGLPVTVQLVGASGADAVLVAVARELEHKFGGWRAP